MKDEASKRDGCPRHLLHEKSAWQPTDVTASKKLYNDLLNSDGKENRKLANNRPLELPEWNRDYVQSSPPNPLTVTKEIQKDKLRTVQDLNVIHAYNQSSEEWLELNGLEAKKLEIESLFSDGKLIGLPVEHPEPRMARYKFEMSALMGFEFRLNRHVALVKERIDWLLSESKKKFGLIKGRVPCILVDTSESSVEDEDINSLHTHLKELLKDQLLKKAKLFLGSFSNEVNFLWTDPRIVNNFIAKECQSWAESLKPSGTCNLLQVLKLAMKKKDIDSLVLIQRNRPDQNQTAIIDYAVEAVWGRNITIHTVSYNCETLSTSIFLEELAAKTGGRFHCFNVNDPEDVKSTDMKLLTDELKRTQEVMFQLEQLKDGNAIENKMIAAIKQPSDELIEADYHQRQEERLKKLDEEYQSLNVEPSSSVLERTSREWLKANSLKAKGLTLYQVMAPNAYSYVTGYVSTINKKVDSKTYHKSMVQMEWHDGSIKNVHIDPVVMFNYQHYLRGALELYQRRLNWLQFESRKWFGTLAQKRVVIIVDMSSATQFGLGELQLSLKILLEQQLSNKSLFNIICCGESVEHFKPTMVEASVYNICEAWKWYNIQNCAGARKYLPALRFVLENVEERKQNIDVDGIYLISTGIPQEPKEVTCSYMAEATLGTNVSLNCMYFQPSSRGSYTLEAFIENSDDVARYLRDLAHQNHGRFHWITSKGIQESDDVILLSEEISKATNYLTKSQLLIDKMQYKRDEKEQAKIDKHLKMLPAPPTNNKVGPPRTNASSEARMNTVRPKSAIIKQAVKKPKRRIVSAKLESSNQTAWRPTSAHSGIPAVPSPVPGKNFRNVAESSFYEEEKPTQKIFYTEVGNDVGCTSRESRLPTSPTRQFFVSDVDIPDEEASISSKDWLYRHSLAKLKLDLNNIVCSAECSHAMADVSSIKRKVHAKYCDIFPTVEVKGKTYHLQLHLTDLENYEKCVEKALRSYTKRLMWLLQGSKNVFGTIIEKNVVIIIDTSGSMMPHISKLKDQLDCLVWEQLYKGKCRFNFIQYSSDVTLWMDELMEPTKENCKVASDWLKGISCYGETATLAALQIAFDYHPDVEGIYLLTDGKPNSSTTMVLREAANMNMNRNVKIHTISFNCNDGVANTFLQMLAVQSKGRYHKFQSEMDDAENLKNLLLSADSASSSALKNSAIFESDDVNLIIKEINRARQFLLQSKSYRSLLRKPQK